MPSSAAQKKPPAFRQGASLQGFSQRRTCSSVAEQQNAGGLFFRHFVARAYRPIEELVRVEIDFEECRTIVDVSGNQSLRQGVLDIALQRPAQRPRAVAAVAQRLVENPLLGFLGDGDGDRLLGKVGVQTLHQQFDDLDEVGVRQRLEENDLVETVEELRVEGLLDFLLDQFLDLV